MKSPHYTAMRYGFLPPRKLCEVSTSRCHEVYVLATVEIVESLHITSHEVWVLATMGIVESLHIKGYKVCVLATVEIVKVSSLKVMR